jgi:hypothetical protein
MRARKFTMNAKITATALFAVFAALSTGAQAQEATFEPAPQFTLGRAAATAPVTGKTREQVRAELEQARKDGSIKAWSAGYIESLPASPISRAEKRAEAAAALRTGEVARINAEAVDFQGQRVTAKQPVYATVAR